MLDPEEYKNAWENRISDRSAHLTLDETIINKVYEYAIHGLSLEGKSIIDYGCGGAYLGRYLLENVNIKRYIGVDISQRAIFKAFDNLRKWPNVTLLKIRPDVFDLSEYKADYFICLSVIQHLPDYDYFHHLFENINESGIKSIILQIRHAEATRFDMDTYKEVANIIYACYTNAKDISHFLTNYDLVEIGEVEQKSKYQYLRYELA